MFQFQLRPQEMEATLQSGVRGHLAGGEEESRLITLVSSLTSSLQKRGLGDEGKFWRVIDVLCIPILTQSFKYTPRGKRDEAPILSSGCLVGAGWQGGVASSEITHFD